MKLLGWMHRKLMQNNIEPMKNSLTGNASTCFSVHTLFDEKNYYVEPTRTLSCSKIKCQKSSNVSEEANQVEELFQEESLEPFDFLAIGTFGTELLNTDPPTPTLPLPYDGLPNQQMDITEDDLKLINSELEKLLEAEEKDDIETQRISIASTITLNNKLIDGADSEGSPYMVTCPLQDYLFATSIELPETDKEVKKEKTTLEELFKRNDKVHDDSVTKCGGAKQKVSRRNVAHFMKKVVKKLHSSSGSCKVSSKNDDDVSLPTKKKLQKVLKMFDRKVYPEEMVEKNLIKLQKGNKKRTSCYQIEQDNESDYIAKASRDNTMEQSSDGGHWIKTDSDYLVLEL